MAILHPNTFYINNADGWSSNYKYDFWNYGNTDVSNNNNPVKKTIYSPSPTDYAEPKTAAFTGFTLSGGSATSGFNVSGSFSKGWYFYCQPNFTGTTIFFYGIGFRDVYSGRVNLSTTGSVAKVNTYGGYWTAGPGSNATLAHNLDFDSGGIDPQYEFFRAYGMSVRSVAE